MSKFELAADADIGGTSRRFKLEPMNGERSALVIMNYEISRKELETISKIPGIDGFEQQSRYVVKVMIGELFDTQKIMDELWHTMVKNRDGKSEQLTDEDLERARENVKKVLGSHPPWPWTDLGNHFPPGSGLPRRY